MGGGVEGKGGNRAVWGGVGWLRVLFGLLGGGLVGGVGGGAL